MFFTHTSSILLFRSTRSSYYHQVFISLVALTLILFLCMSNVYSAQAALSWNPNSESDLEGYNVYWGTTSKDAEGFSAYENFDNALNVTSYTASGLIEGETYFFAVTAYDFSGNESGYSNEVSYDVPATDPMPQFHEAEDMTLVSPLVIGNDIDASGGKYISATTGTNSTSPVPEATLDFTSPEAGTYYIWIRMFGFDSQSDALYAGIDTIWDRVYTSTTNVYEWVKVETSHNSGDYGFNLSQGIHTIQIGHGEINARADALFITNDPTEIPTIPNADPVSDTTPPSDPTYIQATVVSSTQIDIYWDASTDNVGVAGYKVYRDGIQIATTTGTSYQDTGLSPSTTYTYNVSAYDAAGNESVQSSGDSATTSLDVNNPPVLSYIGNMSVNEGQLLGFNISASDLDGDPLSYLASNLPPGASFSKTTKMFTWTPTYDQAGIYSNVNFQVSDDVDTDSQDVTITVNDANRAPVLDPISDITVNEGDVVSFSPTATDPDKEDVLTYTYSGGWMTSDSYTTNYNDAGTHTVTVTVSDGMLTHSLYVMVTVNNVDTTPPNSSIIINDGAESTNSTSVTLSFSSHDDVGVTGYYVSDSSFAPSATDPGWVSVTPTINYDANVPYTLSSGDGNKTIYVWYKDAAGNVSTAYSDTITLITNRAPVLDPISDITVNVGDVVSFSPTATDPDKEDVLTYTYSGGWMTSDSYTTNYNDAGTHTVTVTVSDGTLTDSQDVTVTVNDVSQLVISNLNVASGKAYQIVVDGLQKGARAYVDRKYKYSTVPASLQGSTYIMTANNDKRAKAASFLSFVVNQDVTVYVAHDDRITKKPSWLASFTDTGDNLVTTDTRLSVFVRNYPAGTITLGGNGGDKNKSMYTVVIAGQ